MDRGERYDVRARRFNRHVVVPHCPQPPEVVAVELQPDLAVHAFLAILAIAVRKLHAHERTPRLDEIPLVRAFKPQPMAKAVIANLVNWRSNVFLENTALVWNLLHIRTNVDVVKVAAFVPPDEIWSPRRPCQRFQIEV
eukprot:CAMPEP_0181298990 /NCGR_PEP_ID=MMETSP1101-20121128/6090_1 /TAXON_ID=46948 /ORGANISM="Rhodomonas abbreviata, Strain Caron Lab Isolate" /LENGTH=138 /DNA_ID=CAMNT_0023404075 /DNA_START=465 /DNA_END=881 /DNA_ORIENTATION=+